MQLYSVLLLCPKYISRRNISTLPYSLKIPQCINRFIAYIDDVTGTTEIRETHATLRQNEKTLQNAQALRRKKRDELDMLQSRLKEIHCELDKFSRGDDKYLRLLTEEHAVIKNEQLLLTEVRKADEAEKFAFDELSSTLRTSHIKEQEQSTRVKTWTVIASTLGALFGIIGAWVANEVRMRKIKELVPNAAALVPLVKQMASLVENQQNEIASFITHVRNVMHLKTPDEIANVAPNKNVEDEISEKIIHLLQEQNKVLARELDEIKSLIALELNLNAEIPGVVYIGSDLENLLDKSEKNIESKMKLQTLVEVVFLYTLITVSIPLIYAFFKSS
ncbi:unnamed protein product [Thelazia callipaeda]|uniref:Coiled-coil domain-containing protein 51 n=1 Tax=Thelazia callipaeda TaxID=103827 RepID=A0A0N5CKG2_THECL|nr:unnamed protein product [Thelazia callipaeda]